MEIIILRSCKTPRTKPSCVNDKKMSFISAKMIIFVLLFVRIYVNHTKIFVRINVKV